MSANTEGDDGVCHELEHILGKCRLILLKGLSDCELNKLPKSLAKQIEDQLQPVHGKKYGQDTARVSLKSSYSQCPWFVRELSTRTVIARLLYMRDRLIGLFWMCACVIACGGFSIAVPKPIFDQDLRSFGVVTNAHGSIMGFYPDLAFLSDRLLLVSINRRVFGPVEPLFADKAASTLLLFDLVTGRLITSRSFVVEKSDGSVQAIDDGRFVLLNQDGIRVCSTDFDCGPVLPTKGPVFVSPRGTRLVVGGNGQTSQKLLEAGTLRILREFEGGGKEQAIPGDSGLLIRRDKTIHMVRGNEDVQLPFTGVGIWPEARFLNGSKAAELNQFRGGLLVSDLDGRMAYQKPTSRALGAELTVSAGEHDFAVHEEGYTRLNSIINFLDIDSGRPSNRELIRIYEIDSGRELLSLEWDPRPYVGVLAKPALSPDGKKIATVRSGHLQVFAVP